MDTRRKLSVNDERLIAEVYESACDDLEALHKLITESIEKYKRTKKSVSCAVLAEKFGVTNTVIYEGLRRQGVDYFDPPTAFDVKQRKGRQRTYKTSEAHSLRALKKLHRYYKMNLTTKEIAEITGYTRDSISSLLTPSKGHTVKGIIERSRYRKTKRVEVTA